MEDFKEVGIVPISLFVPMPEQGIGIWGFRGGNYRFKLRGKWLERLKSTDKRGLNSSEPKSFECWPDPKCFL
jgi:hypothetical protein